MIVQALSWNLFHGRDFPPDPALRTWRSRLLRISERNATHVQVNRELRSEFAARLDCLSWDVALLQESPPRWCDALAQRCGADAHRVLTSRNSWGRLRAALAGLNPDLVASNEGGSNLTLVRAAAGAIVERRELELSPGPRPERRAMAFTRIRPADPTAPDLCVANLHASTGAARRQLAEHEVLRAAERAVEWSGASPLLFGGDLNLRPAQSAVFERLAERFDLGGPTGPQAIDHLLLRGATAIEPAYALPPESREFREDGFAVRLSDHAPVQTRFEV